MEGQKNRNTDKENIEKWVLYFLDKIYNLSQKLDKKYDVLKSKGSYLNERQIKIKKYIQKNQPLKISDISKAFEEISIHTIKKDLQYLKQEQIIKNIGQGKATVYVVDSDE